jgi:dTDP-4-dehydrorhamnose 3,5-epimerase
VRFTPTEIPDVVLIEPDVFEDARGFFFEVYHTGKYRAAGIDTVFVQDNHSRSVQGTLRGLHAQVRRPQAKLVRVLAGQVFDVAVDVRRGSPTYLRWVGATLSASNRHQLFVPTGFVHGFCVLSEAAEIEYKCSDVYDPGGELGIAWNDPTIGIVWPIETPLLSSKDASLPRVTEVEATLPVWTPAR